MESIRPLGRSKVDYMSVKIDRVKLLVIFIFLTIQVAQFWHNFLRKRSIAKSKICFFGHNLPKPARPIAFACNFPTELISTYLDRITTPLIQSLPSSLKYTNHMLRISDPFHFPGISNYVFTMDVKSLYTVIPNGDGLLALTHFLNKRPVA